MFFRLSIPGSPDRAFFFFNGVGSAYSIIAETTTVSQSFVLTRFGKNSISQVMAGISPSAEISGGRPFPLLPRKEFFQPTV